MRHFRLLWPVYLLLACSEECPRGEPCDRTCPAGEIAICVVEGACNCVVDTDGGLGGEGGGGAGGGVDQCAVPQPGDLVVNEVMIDGEGADGPTEFIELVNTTDAPVSLRGVRVTSNGSGMQKERVTFNAGCLPARGAVAMFAASDAWVWSPMPNPVPTFQVSSFAFPNTEDFAFEVRDSAGVELDRGFGPAALIESGISATRNPELTGLFALHSEVAPGTRQSPALCANGGTFASGCEPGGMGGAGGMGMGGAGGMGMGGAGGNPDPCDPPAVGDLVVNEVMINGQGTDLNTEFVELVNARATPVSVRGVTITYARNAMAAVDAVRFQGGCLPARGAVALFYNPASWVWEPQPETLPVGMTVGSASGYAFNNSDPFRFTVRLGELIINEVAGLGAVIRDGTSAVRSPELVGELVVHDTVAPTRLSPARCANGATFAEDCMPGGMGGAGGMGMGGAGGMGMGGMGGSPPLVDMGVNPGCRAPGIGDLRINESFNNPLGDDGGVEFLEVVNAAGEPIDLTGVIVQTNNSNGVLTDRVTFRAGCIATDGVVVIRGPTPMWQWTPAPVVAPNTVGSLSLLNSGAITLQLSRDGVAIDTLAGAANLIVEGTSINRNPEVFGVPALHTDLNPAVRSSPGLCANGGALPACVAP